MENGATGEEKLTSNMFVLLSKNNNATTAAHEDSYENPFCNV